MSTQPISLEKFTELAHRTASRYSHRSELEKVAYTFLPHTLEDFHRQVCVAIEANTPAVPASTGWVARKDWHSVPVLFDPYTGEPRDARDIHSDPQGILIAVPGAYMVPAAPQPQPVAQPVQAQPSECHGLDTAERVCFYEQDFYVLSNFSSFTLQWRGERFDTSEAAYHYEKFPRDLGIRMQILRAPSAHEAFKIAERYKKDRRGDWDSVKVEIMRAILRAKVCQHEYVKRKLLATGNRLLIENSWRDDYWGWGPRKDGSNMLGRLWMDVRAELLAQPKPANQQKE